MQLIDVDALEFMDFETCDTDDWYPIKERVRGRNEIRKIVKDAPTVYAVPVVRCKDCVYSQGHFTNTPVKCGCGYGTHGEDFFCADGERRTE